MSGRLDGWLRSLSTDPLPQHMRELRATNKVENADEASVPAKFRLHASASMHSDADAARDGVYWAAFGVPTAIKTQAAESAGMQMHALASAGTEEQALPPVPPDAEADLLRMLVEREELAAVVRQYEAAVESFLSQERLGSERPVPATTTNTPSHETAFRQLLHRSRAFSGGEQADQRPCADEAADAGTQQGPRELYQKLETLRVEPPQARRCSGSSSFLYAGVEPRSAALIRLASTGSRSAETGASAPSVHYRDAEVEANVADPDRMGNLRIVPALTALTLGGWLYKYPRRQYCKLIMEPLVPEAQLSYRYFWLNPMQALLCWAAKPGAPELKQVQVQDFYTEERSLRRSDPDAPAEKATIIIVFTQEESPLALVPTNSQDLEKWLFGLQKLVRMRCDPAWPENIAVCSSL